MCTTCGCGDPSGTRVGVVHQHGDGEVHAHPHPAAARPADGATRTVQIEHDILERNDALATANRIWLADRHILALNMMSSPGAGKTTLLQRTIREIAHERPVAVIEGDQETDLDAARIRATGVPVVQINTGAGCHLDADMLRRGLEALAPADHSVVFVENVGNLVCPALFDLGEAARVVVISVTEGDDKPLKYPHMFAAADLVVINKVDLLPYVDFDVERCTADARRLNPSLEFLPLSVTRGDGLAGWTRWVAAHTVSPAPTEGR
jgi:hydrogenase nickel incorporation protein HypB